MHLINFNSLCFHFHTGIFKISFVFFSCWPNSYSITYCSISTFVIFLAFFLQLTSSFIPLWSEKILELISILLNLLRIILWPDTWCILENGPCTLEKNVSDAFGWNVLYKSVKFIWSNFHLWPLFSCWFSVWIICPFM